MEQNEIANAQKLCFVIMQFGAADTPEFKTNRALYESIIKPAVEEAGLGYSCKRSDDIMHPGSVIKDIVKALWDADVVIADLTGRNPNVFYELGVRHALKGRTILLTQSIEDVPFDVRSYRVIQYVSNSAAGFREVIIAIREHLRDLKGQPDLRESPVIDSLPQVVCSTPETRSDAREDPAARDFRIVRAAIEGLERRFDAEVASRIDSLGGIGELQRDTTREIAELLSVVRPGVLSQLASRLDKVADDVEGLARAEVLSHVAEKYGLVNIYKNRLLALDDFYAYLEKETTQIDIVGSTLFGLRGSASIDTARILDLIQAKRTSHSPFVLRMLLTHYEYLSTRMDQERRVKTPDRYVISGEAVKAIEELKKRELLDSVRFYRGAPTCFTVLCHGQKLLLVNPYPYEREAYSSWALIFREVATGIYREFMESHVDKPWDNDLLTERYSPDYESALRNKADEDYDKSYHEKKAGKGRSKRGQPN